MQTPEIIGFMLVRNEDLFVEQALMNVLDFCDRIIVLDNDSQDGTAAILARLSATHSKIEVQQISDTSRSHEPLEPMAGSNIWVLGVDGDELYDARGLQALREKIVQGVFRDWWVLFGNVLNCTGIDWDTMQARGYLAPPCRSMTKLYNFQMLKSWTNCPQRLHGGEQHFVRGDASLRHDIYKHVDWADADFRCLHTCFMRRSTLDPEMQPAGMARQNVTEEQHTGIKRAMVRWLLSRVGRQLRSNWKLEKYRRGPLVTADVSPFLTHPAADGAQASPEDRTVVTASQ